jgi:hypothetical protein
VACGRIIRAPRRTRRRACFRRPGCGTSAASPARVEQLRLGRVDRAPRTRARSGATRRRRPQTRRPSVARRCTEVLTSHRITPARRRPTSRATAALPPAAIRSRTSYAASTRSPPIFADDQSVRPRRPRPVAATPARRSRQPPAAVASAIGPFAPPPRSPGPAARRGQRARCSRALKSAIGDGDLADRLGMRARRHLARRRPS